jgi:hypothetical protein
MGSFMVYEALCEFTNTTQDKDIVKLINPEKLSIANMMKILCI